MRGGADRFVRLRQSWTVAALATGALAGYTTASCYVLTSFSGLVGPVDASPSRADGMVDDRPTADAEPTEDTSPPSDGARPGAMDSGVTPPTDTGADASCAPPSQLAFTPVGISNLATASACASDVLTAIFTSCLGATASTTSCNLASANNPACFGCLFTGYGGGPLQVDGGGMTSPPPAGPWGPFVVLAGLLLPNTGGCVEALDPSQSTCAAALTDQLECEVAACFAVCPLDGTDSGTLTQQAQALQECMSEANTAVCASETSAANGECAAAMDGGAAVCFDASALETMSGLEQFVSPFCGP